MHPFDRGGVTKYRGENLPNFLGPPCRYLGYVPKEACFVAHNLNRKHKFEIAKMGNMIIKYGWFLKNALHYSIC